MLLLLLLLLLQQQLLLLLLLVTTTTTTTTTITTTTTTIAAAAAAAATLYNFMYMLQRVQLLLLRLPLLFLHRFKPIQSLFFFCSIVSGVKQVPWI